MQELPFLIQISGIPIDGKYIASLSVEYGTGDKSLTYKMPGAAKEALADLLPLLEREMIRVETEGVEAMNAAARSPSPFTYTPKKVKIFDRGLFDSAMKRAAKNIADAVRGATKEGTGGVIPAGNYGLVGERGPGPLRDLSFGEAPLKPQKVKPWAWPITMESIADDLTHGDQPLTVGIDLASQPDTQYVANWEGHSNGPDLKLIDAALNDDGGVSGDDRAKSLWQAFKWDQHRFPNVNWHDNYKALIRGGELTPHARDALIKIEANTVAVHRA